MTAAALGCLEPEIGSHGDVTSPLLFSILAGRVLCLSELVHVECSAPITTLYLRYLRKMNIHIYVSFVTDERRKVGRKF